MYKVVNSFAPTIVSELFSFSNVEVALSFINHLQIQYGMDRKPFNT